MNKTVVLCVNCLEDVETPIVFGPNSSRGLCETCFKFVLEDYLPELTPLNSFSLFVRRLLHIGGKPEPYDFDKTQPPIVRLTNLIFVDAFRRHATKIRYTIEQREMPFGHVTTTEPIEAHVDGYNRTMQSGVHYLIEGEWHEMMRPPTKLFPAMIRRLKLLANLPANYPEPVSGKMLLRINATDPDGDILDGYVFPKTPYAEFFIVNFTVPTKENEFTVVELTRVRSDL